MSYYIYLGTIFLIFFQVGSASRIKTRIVNGAEARPGEFPYQISLHNLGTHDCGGTILNEEYVLTAAHCVSTNFPAILKVIAGTTNVKNLTDSATVHKVTEIHLHEDYKPFKGWLNDIALLKVNPPFIFNAYVAPAKLPLENESVQPQQGAVVSGFGKTAKNETLSPHLLKTNVWIVDLKRCQNWYISDPLSSTHVCAGNAFDTTGFCKGDSGGPLTANGKVVGIVSFAANGGCVNKDNSPQVYTKVSAYIDWISGHMNKNVIIHH